MFWIPVKKISNIRLTKRIIRQEKWKKTSKFSKNRARNFCKICRFWVVCAFQKPSESFWFTFWLLCGYLTASPERVLYASKRIGHIRLTKRIIRQEKWKKFEIFKKSSSKLLQNLQILSRMCFSKAFRELFVHFLTALWISTGNSFSWTFPLRQ